MKTIGKILIILCCAALSTAAFGLDPNDFRVSDAHIYLPFEGVDTGYDSEPWENKGTLVPGERPWPVLEYHRGDPNTIPLITVTGPDGGIVGQAADTSHFSLAQPGNVHWWGAKGTTTTPLEEAVVGTKSMTITLWWYATQWDLNNMVFYSPQAYILDKDHWSKINIAGQYENVAPSTYDARNQWTFCAITIDTTSTTDNIKYYGGSPTKPLTLYQTKSQNLLGLFSGDWWFGLGFGFPTGSINNPFIGYIDEVRIYLSHEDDTGALTMDNIQKVFESVTIDTCEKVQQGGYTLPGDLNGDCSVDFEDFALAAIQWQDCNDPEDIDCVPNW